MYFASLSYSSQDDFPRTELHYEGDVAANGSAPERKSSVSDSWQCGRYKDTAKVSKLSGAQAEAPWQDILATFQRDVY